MHYLALHCKSKKNDPITEENGPENRDVKRREEGHQKGDTESLCNGIPKTTQARAYITESQLAVIKTY